MKWSYHGALTCWSAALGITFAIVMPAAAQNVVSDVPTGQSTPGAATAPISAAEPGTLVEPAAQAEAGPSAAVPAEAEPVAVPAPAAQADADQTSAVPATQPAPGAEQHRRSYAEINATLDAVLKTLVDRQILSVEEAERMKHEAAQAATTTAEEPPPPVGEKVIRVPYIPERTKNQIRDEVQMGLQESTVQAVFAQAKQERWGLPGVLPNWVMIMKLKGDVRVRGQADLFASDNPVNVYPDFSTVNSRGGVGRAGLDAYLNATEERYRMRVRARLGLDAKLTETLKAGLRLTTGNTTDPVSTNQTLGTYANRYQVVWDQVYLKYDGYDADRYKWLTVYGGRMPNPWLYSDLVWDHDLGFEGLAATTRFNMSFSGGLLEQDEKNRTLFFTAGAFPLQEVERTSQDKWLYGAQVGIEWITLAQSVFKMGVAYYSYDNIMGERNELDSNEKDYTAPRFMQKGNTLFDIRNDLDLNTDLWALAADYELLNVTATMDLASFAPTHLWLTLDWVENIGFDAEEVMQRTGGSVEEKTTGYQAQLSVGWPDVAVRGNWRAHLAYRYLERDAVLDAFTDSDFHLGGTDAKGWIIGADYGLMDNAWLSLRYLSSDPVDGPPLGIDTVQVDINGRF